MSTEQFVILVIGIVSSYLIGQKSGREDGVKIVIGTFMTMSSKDPVIKEHFMALMAANQAIPDNGTVSHYKL